MKLGKSRREKEATKVAAIGVLRDGKLLFGKRIDNGKWSCPAGHLEPGEMPVDGAKRELFEETGMKVESIETLGTSNTHQPTVYAYTVDAPEDFEPTAENDPDEEFSEFKWFGQDELPPSEEHHVPLKHNLVLNLLGWISGDNEAKVLNKSEFKRVWRSRDGIEIPHKTNPNRKAWDKSFVNGCINVFAQGNASRMQPIKVPITEHMGSNMAVNKDRLRLYTRMAAAGDKLPPVVVRRMGEGWHLIDGNHRLEAARSKGLTHLDALELMDAPVAPQPTKGKLVPIRKAEKPLFQQTAFRHRTTGAIVPSGPIHNYDVLPAAPGESFGTAPRTNGWDAGFLTHDGKFMDRWEAERHAQAQGAPKDRNGGGESYGMRDRGLMKSELFQQTAFRHKKTGKVLPSGPMHIFPEPGLSNADYEDGFLTHDGRFFNRKDAATLAAQNNMPVKEGESDTLRYAGLMPQFDEEKWEQGHHSYEATKLNKHLLAAMALAGSMALAGTPPEKPHQGPSAALGAAKAAGLKPGTWGLAGLHDGLIPIAHLESNFGLNTKHTKNIKGPYHTAVGALGLKPVTAHEEYKKSKVLQDKFPNLNDPADFMNRLQGDHRFYNLVASAHWTRLLGKHGSPEKAAYAWRHGTGAAGAASQDQIDKDTYVQKYKHLALSHGLKKAEDLEKGIMTRRHTSYWGASHRGSKQVTYHAAQMMGGVKGYDSQYENEFPEGKQETKRLAEFFLRNMHNHRSPEPLYHSFENTKNLPHNVGDVVTLPLAASSGKKDSTYGIRLDKENQKGEPTVYEFPKGIPHVPYSKWDASGAKEFGYSLSEGIVSGKFKVKGTRYEQSPYWQHDRAKGTAEQVKYKVVTLEPHEYFHPEHGWFKANESPVASKLKLTKAIGDLKPGKQIGSLPTSGLSDTEFKDTKLFDYSHLLGPLLSRKYQLVLSQKQHIGGQRHRVGVTLGLRGKGRLGDLQANVEGGKMEISASAIDNPEHQGKGLGKAMYEAALTHGYHHLKARTVTGDKHSTQAETVHRALARKHGLDYQTSMMPQSHLETSRPFDGAYGGYEYALKTELQKAQHPEDFHGVLKASSQEGRALVDHTPDLNAHPREMQGEVDQYRAMQSHPKRYKRKSAARDSGITQKLIYEHPESGQKYMVKPYHEGIVSRITKWQRHPHQGWAEMTNQALYHAAGIGHLHQKVHVSEHEMVQNPQEGRIPPKSFETQRQEMSQLSMKMFPKTKGVLNNVGMNQYELLRQAYNKQRAAEPRGPGKPGQQVAGEPALVVHMQPGLTEASEFRGQGKIIGQARIGDDGYPVDDDKHVVGKYVDKKGWGQPQHVHEKVQPDHDALRKLTVMDFLSNNLDRHGGNLMFNENGQPLSVDHSRSFQYVNTRGNKHLPQQAMEMKARLPEGVSDRFWNYVDGGNFEAAYPTSIGSHLEDHMNHDRAKSVDRYQVKMETLQKWAPIVNEWWPKNRDAIVNTFEKRVKQIRDPAIQGHLLRNFKERVKWLDERAHHGLESYGTDWHQDTGPQLFLPGMETSEEIEGRRKMAAVAQYQAEEAARQQQGLAAGSAGTKRAKVQAKR